MSGNRTPGTQGLGAGGVQGIDNSILARTRSCLQTITNGNPLGQARAKLVHWGWSNSSSQR
ncbi:MAG: hypothetical protein DRQ43_11670 [Gammaproteobacteria bacterium]|nr:MAG: hypothetical protein DRQ43_11670 [Gammaproteobacteria bacterium]